ncbi:potassium voltage-gated channel subfamily KQT member 2-like [Gadus chalcogrammus]|uniref:potassium voltage-gated channel subfamily KQT member 2-like n=1 Tax=Gadus chalcogrammus TaxID=1042646 RepID=UPI0024C232C1|nr:potassium voltage-gated channel subfamily KQT member 2-like [Gadus chalcogrammus]
MTAEPGTFPEIPFTPKLIPPLNQLDLLRNLKGKTFSRKASLKEKVFSSPTKTPPGKAGAPSPGAEDGAEASPSKVGKSWSFADKNRAPKHSFRVRGSASRQNSEAIEGLISKTLAYFFGFYRKCPCLYSLEASFPGEEMGDDKNCDCDFYQELSPGLKVTIRAICIMKFQVAKRRFKESLRPYDVMDVIEQYSAGHLDMLCRIKNLQCRIDLIVGPPAPSTPRHKKSADGPRVDQIVGKSMKDGDTTEDGSMMGRLGRVEKQVCCMDRKLDFLVHAYVQRMGIPRSETEAFFSSKEPYPAPPYHSPEQQKAEEEEEEEVRAEKELKVYSAVEVMCSEGSVERRDTPLGGQSANGSLGTPSISHRPTTSWQHQLQHPLAQPAWGSSMANTPSPVGGSGEQSPTLYRLPPPPASTHDRSVSSAHTSGRDSGSQSRRRHRRPRGPQEQPAAVAESDTSVSIPSVDHEELERSFSGFSISQAKEDFFGPSFYASPGGGGGRGRGRGRDAGGATRCAKVRPFLAEGESDTDSELYAPSPQAYTPDGAYLERGWPGHH